MIDPHVHLRDWKQKDKETVAHGLRVAKAAGITRVFDMPNTNPPLTDRATVLDRLSLGSAEARKLGMGYHVYAGLTGDLAQVVAMARLRDELFPLVVGLKMFLAHSTGNMGLVDEETQRRVVGKLAEIGYRGVLAVHAECEALNDPSLFDPADLSTHSLARPAASEVMSVAGIVKICRETGFKGHLHICHVSTAGAIALVKEAKADGMRISAGATAHHALLCSDDARDSSRGLKMNPPLRTASDRDAVFSALLDGAVDLVESDHAPHTRADKEKGASGIPGFQGTLLLLDRLRRAGASEERLADLFGKNAIRTFALLDEDVFLPDDAKARFFEIDDEYPCKPFLWS